MKTVYVMTCLKGKCETASYFYYIYTQLVL